VSVQCSVTYVCNIAIVQCACCFTAEMTDTRINHSIKQQKCFSTAHYIKKSSSCWLILFEMVFWNIYCCLTYVHSLHTMHMHACTRTLHTHTTHKHIHAHTHIHTRTHIHTHTRTHAHCTHTTHTHTHTRTHTHTHTLQINKYYITNTHTCMSVGLTVGLMISVGSETLMDVLGFSSLLANTPSFFAGTCIVEQCLVYVVSLEIV